MTVAGCRGDARGFAGFDDGECCIASCGLRGLLLGTPESGHFSVSLTMVVAGTREGASNKLAPGSARGKQVRSSSAAAKAVATKCRVDRDLRTLWWPPSRPHQSHAPGSPGRARGYIVGRAFARHSPATRAFARRRRAGEFGHFHLREERIARPCGAEALAFGHWRGSSPVPPRLSAGASRVPEG